MSHAADYVQAPAQQAVYVAPPASILWDRALTVALAIAIIALFARVMSYPLQHDEQFYVSAGILFSPGGLYPRLGFSHLPNLPILLHMLYSLPLGTHYLLVARLLICGVWIATIAAVILLGRAVAASRLTIVMMVVLLVTNPLMLGPTGMAATNNMIAMPFALFGLLAFVKGVAPPHPRPAMLALCGALLALAAGFKINYAVLILPFAVASLLVPARLAFRQRMATVMLPLLIGGLAGASPILFFLVQDPAGLFAHAVSFHRGPQIGFWLANPDPLDPKIMDLRGKLLLAQQLWLSGGTMVLVMTAAVLATANLPVWRTSEPSAPTKGWQLWLVAAVTILAALVSFPPTPSFPQYFTLPIPFALILLAVLDARLREDQRTAMRPLLVAGMAISTIAGAPMLLSSAPALIKPGKWTGFQVHSDAGHIAQLVGTSGSPAPIATLGPLYALEGGRAVYPALGLGPFVYRATAFVPPAERAHFTNLVSPASVGGLLEATCPSGVLVGLEGALDQPLADFARREHYIAQPIRLHAAGQKAGLLLVRPPSAGRVCAPVSQPVPPAVVTAR